MHHLDLVNLTCDTVRRHVPAKFVVLIPMANEAPGHRAT